MLRLKQRASIIFHKAHSVEQGTILVQLGPLAKQTLQPFPPVLAPPTHAAALPSSKDESTCSFSVFAGACYA